MAIGAVIPPDQAVELWALIAGPESVTGVVFAHVWAWNDFLFAFTFLNSPDKQAATLGIFNFIAQYYVAWNDVMTASLLAVLPAVVRFLAVKRQIVQVPAEGTAN